MAACPLIKGLYEETSQHRVTSSCNSRKNWFLQKKHHQLSLNQSWDYWRCLVCRNIITFFNSFAFTPWSDLFFTFLLWLAATVPEWLAWSMSRTWCSNPRTTNNISPTIKNSDICSKLWVCLFCLQAIFFANPILRPQKCVTSCG